MTPSPRLFSVRMAALLAAPAAAQNSGWGLALSPYLWAPGIRSSVGTPWARIAIDKSTGDLLSSRDLGFMGRFEARNGRWGLIADLFRAVLSQSRDTPFSNRELSISIPRSVK